MNGTQVLVQMRGCESALFEQQTHVPVEPVVSDGGVVQLQSS